MWNPDIPQAGWPHLKSIKNSEPKQPCKKPLLAGITFSTLRWKVWMSCLDSWSFVCCVPNSPIIRAWTKNFVKRRSKSRTQLWHFWGGRSTAFSCRSVFREVQVSTSSAHVLTCCKCFHDAIQHLLCIYLIWYGWLDPEVLYHNCLKKSSGNQMKEASKSGNPTQSKDFVLCTSFHRGDLGGVSISSLCSPRRRRMDGNPIWAIVPVAASFETCLFLFITSYAICFPKPSSLQKGSPYFFFEKFCWVSLISYSPTAPPKQMLQSAPVKGRLAASARGSAWSTGAGLSCKQSCVKKTPPRCFPKNMHMTIEHTHVSTLARPLPFTIFLLRKMFKMYSLP